MSVSGSPWQEGKFGPTLRGGPGRRDGIAWGRIAKGLLGILSGLAVVLFAGVGALVYIGEASMEDLSVPGLNTEPAPTDAAGPDFEEVAEVRNVLVVGSDSREGLSDEQLQAIGTTDEGRTGLTDTIMLVQLDPRRDGVVILSFPRDLLVTHCDGRKGRVNAAYARGERMEVGGPGCLVETVTAFTRIPIDHYVEVDFAGFIDVVDALGGVSFYLQEPLRDRAAGLNLDAGCVTLDGADAIGFVRARHIDSDFGRIARQQRFIREVLEEATSAGTLLNYPKLVGLVRAAARAVDTDRNLSFDEMVRIAYSLRDLSNDRLDTRTVPARNRTVGGASYVVAVEDDAEELFEAFRVGSLVPSDLGTAPPAEVTIADVPAIDILNGVGVAGLAAEAAAALEKRGLAVDETGNADSFEFDRTQVIYSPDRREEAELVSAALGGVELVPGEPAQDLQLVLGSDFVVADLPPPPRRPSSAPTAASQEPTFAGAAPSTVEC